MKIAVFTDTYSPKVDGIVTSIMNSTQFLAKKGHKIIIFAPEYKGELARQEDVAYRVLADHIRTLTFAVTDGAVPNNEGRGYIIRRILRRAARFGLVLDMHEPFLYQLVPILVEQMGEVFPELTGRAQHVADVIQAEEASFAKTLDRGMDIFAADVKDMQKNNMTELPGEKAFRLYDTYGFPLDLTQLLAVEHNLSVDNAGFEKLMQQQRSRSRASQKNVAYEADALAEILPETHDADKYLTTSVHAQLLGYIMEDQFVTEGAVPANTRVALVLDRTCAYAESGGQVGDKGIISTGSMSFSFDDTQRIGSAIAHFGTTESADIIVGAEMTITIDQARQDTKANHTATHLLQWALQEVLGKHVHQEGSLVCCDYLRFDFTHPRALTREQIDMVEALVRDKIEAALSVTFKVMPVDEARQLGAMSLFSEKYGDFVRVLAIGTAQMDKLEEAFSMEFCGGTHTTNTSQIGSFMITREESIATGIRRITAMTGRALNEMLYKRNCQVEQLVSMLKTTPENLTQRVEALLQDNKKLKKQLEKGNTADLKSAARKLLDNAETIDQVKIIIGQMPPATPDIIRSQIDWLRKKAPTSVIVLGITTGDGKVMLFAAVTDDLVEKGLKAGDIIKQIAPIVGGKGGGRPQLAQAGGKNPKNLPDALKTAGQFIKERIH